MAEGAEECMFVKSTLSSSRVRVLLGREVEYDSFLGGNNEGAEALADNPLDSGCSKHVDVRLHFTRDTVRAGVTKIVRVDPEW